MKASSNGEEDDDDDDGDDDFDDVPEKEGYEPHIPEHLRAEYGESNYTHMHVFHQTKKQKKNHSRCVSLPKLATVCHR